MHELGILRQALGRVQKLAEENSIAAVRYVAFEIGDSSGVVPAYFEKLYPMARELFPALEKSELRYETVAGSGLKIKEIAY